MVYKFALFTKFLLASTALAVPSSRLDARLARRRESRLSPPLDLIEAPGGAVSNTQYTPGWAGAVYDKDEGTFTTVTGTFIVPTPSSSSGAAAVWVGIDGDTCGTAILQTGIDFTVTNGEVSYDAWYEWYPDYAVDFSGITINAGDVIKATVTASSTTTGVAVIENLTTRQTVTRNITSDNVLCEKNAEWIVEDFSLNGSRVPLANFGTVVFTGATASGPSGVIYTPSGATTFDIEQNDQVLTSVSVIGESVIIQYV